MGFDLLVSLTHQDWISGKAQEINLVNRVKRINALRFESGN
jgi:hypothetical protein